MVGHELPVSIRSVTTTRLVGAILVSGIGLCEALTTSPWFDPDRMPEWLAYPIVITGFFAVLILWSFIGNAALAIGSFLIIWRGWRWPLWVAALISIPFWLVTYRLIPKPW